jgi:hypothetical protein
VVLAELSGVSGWCWQALAAGLDDAFRALTGGGGGGNCVETVAGKYTYELCFFKEVRQRNTGNKHSWTSLVRGPPPFPVRLPMQPAPVGATVVTDRALI